MRQHAKAKHNLTAPECKLEQSKYLCFLQSSTTYSPQYWVVGETLDPERQTLAGDQHPVTEQEQLLRLEAEEETRLLDERTVALDRELEHDENTERLRGCE
jgi:hypothetical protein